MQKKFIRVFVNSVDIGSGIFSQEMTNHGIAYARRGNVGLKQTLFQLWGY